MEQIKRDIPKFVICLNNAEYPASLELHKVYRIIRDEDAADDGDLRVIDESAEDYRYPASWFAVVEQPRAVQDLKWSSEWGPLQAQAIDFSPAISGNTL